MTFHESLTGEALHPEILRFPYPHLTGVIRCPACEYDFHWLEAFACPQCGYQAQAPHKVVMAPHEPDARYPRILEEMKTLGAPLLRVFEEENRYIALEGSHRLAAARELRLMPSLFVLRGDLHMEWQGWGSYWEPLELWLTGLRASGSWWETSYDFS